MPSLSRLFPPRRSRRGGPAVGSPVLNATVIAVLVGPWIFATWSLIDSVLDHL